MHPAAYAYLQAVDVELRPQRVLELGSHDRNGRARDAFGTANWTGLDLTPGPEVDIVADARTWRGQVKYDCVLSTSLLEHVEGWPLVIATALAHCEPDGYVVTATVKAPCKPHSADGGPLRPGEYYGDVDEEMLRAAHGYAHVEVATSIFGDVFAIGSPTDTTPRMENVLRRTVLFMNALVCVERAEGRAVDDGTYASREWFLR